MDINKGRKQRFVINEACQKATLHSLRKFGLLSLAFLCLYGMGTFITPGFDWLHFFSKGIYPSFWMPWTKPIVSLFNYPAVFALTILSIGVRAFSYRVSPVALALTILSLPTLWVVFMGNLDGFVLAGLVTLPWGVPLVLIKPQISAFALLAKRSSLVAAMIWVILSFVIWGFWPLTWGVIFSPEWQAEWVQDITIFPWGLFIAIPLLWLSRGDEDLLMAAGSLCTPHLFPYHYIVLMPVLGRMRWPWMLATWIISFTPLLANWLGPAAWHFGNLIGVFFWLGLYLSLDPEKRKSWRISRPLHWGEFFKM